MDSLTIISSFITALVVGVVTAYVTNRMTTKRENAKEERTLAEKIAEFSSDDAQKAEKLAKQFAIAFLVYLPEGAKNREKVFIPSSGSVLVGRSKNCDIVLKDPTISRQHAVFSGSDSQIYLRDMSSSIGTYINQRRIPANVPFLLKDKDEIKIGIKTTFIFHKM